MGGSAFTTPETTGLLFTPYLTLASLQRSSEPHVTGQPTFEAQMQRDGRHNLSAVMFVWSDKTEGCDCAAITTI